MGSLYEYFTNKEAVFEQMARRFVAEVVTMLQPLVPELAIAILACVHFWVLVKKDITEPLLYALITAVLLGLRAWWREQERRRQLAGAYAPPPQARGKVIPIVAK